VGWLGLEIVRTVPAAGVATVLLGISPQLAEVIAISDVFVPIAVTAAKTVLVLKLTWVIPRMHVSINTNDGLLITVQLILESN
jgi:hypothetical protein